MRHLTGRFETTIRQLFLTGLIILAGTTCGPMAGAAGTPGANAEAVPEGQTADDTASSHYGRGLAAKSRALEFETAAVTAPDPAARARLESQAQTAYQEAVTYYRRDIETTDSSALKKVDAWFINDNYWLLFPFHIAWDSDITLEDIGRQKLPLGGGQAKCVVITFPASGGYTPGDVYEIYLNDDSRLLQWVYRRGGSEQPTRVTTWENYRPAGPLVLALDHQAGDDSFRLWFTGVGVKLAGSDNWMFTE